MFPSNEYVPYSYYSQAWCYEKLGEYMMAVTAFNKVVKLYSEHELAVNARYKVAEILYGCKDYDNAIRELKVFIKEYPINERIFDAYYMLGDCYYKRGEFLEAIKAFKNSITGSRDKPARAIAEYKMGKAYLFLEDVSSALDWFDKASEDSNDPSIQSLALIVFFLPSM